MTAFSVVCLFALGLVTGTLLYLAYHLDQLLRLRIREAMARAVYAELAYRRLVDEQDDDDSQHTH